MLWLVAKKLGLQIGASSHTEIIGFLGPVTGDVISLTVPDFLI